MSDVPALIAVTRPLVPIVATAGVPEAQVPPAIASVSDVVAPVQACATPAIGVGDGFTVTIVVAAHPLLVV